MDSTTICSRMVSWLASMYKILDRCMHSKCRYTKTDGFAFDLDGDPGEDCPATDMEKIADLLKNRAMVYGRGNTRREV